VECGRRGDGVRVRRFPWAQGESCGGYGSGDALQGGQRDPTYSFRPTHPPSLCFSSPSFRVRAGRCEDHLNWSTGIIFHSVQNIPCDCLRTND
jgi:hypothetical protein